MLDPSNPLELTPHERVSGLTLKAEQLMAEGKSEPTEYARVRDAAKLLLKDCAYPFTVDTMTVPVSELLRATGLEQITHQGTFPTAS